MGIHVHGIFVSRLLPVQPILTQVYIIMLWIVITLPPIGWVKFPTQDVDLTSNSSNL